MGLALVLRAVKLDAGLWYDEIKTLIDSVRPPLAEILTHFPGNNDHPLYSVLAHISISIFGEHAWSLRLPSVIFGLAAIPMLYIFALQVTTRLEAVAAACLLAISYHHIWFSQNARGYAMLLFWTLLTSYLLLEGLKNNRRATFVAYAAVAALGVYTHLTMVFVVASHVAVAAWHVLFARPGKSDMRALINPALGFVLAGIFTLLLYAPILAEVHTFFEEKSVSREARVATPGWAFLAALRGLNIGFTVAGGTILAGLLVLIGAWSYLRQSIAISALFVLPAPIILAVAVMLQRPVFPRFFFVLMGFGLLIAVRGAVILGNWIANRLPASGTAQRLACSLPVVLIGGLVILSALALPRLYAHPKQAYEQALRFVEGSRQKGESIVVVGAGAADPYQHYYSKPWPRIESVEELTAARETGSLWLIYTFRRYIEHRQPVFWNAIETTCAPVKSFPATVAGGEIEIRKCEAK
ncbi:MAG: glycosyltransferase family 39 protein [Gammaproteobacteria bacterium]|nr:glycosyltransferase family 39 protein [Gammaproteobacteria bacterium]